MIIGNGLIASAFKLTLSENSDVIVFASGVSNSGEARSEAFLRERKLLVEALKYKKYILYFSTCSMHDLFLKDTPYVTHKMEMESLVRTASEYSIFRLPQVVGKTTNPNTLTNHLYHKITTGSKFEIWQNAKRYLIDIDDVASIVNWMVNASLVKNDTVNIAAPFSISILSLVRIFELVLRKKAIYTLLDTGGTYSIDSDFSKLAANQCGVNFNETYIENIIRKYYGE